MVRTAREEAVEAAVSMGFDAATVEDRVTWLCIAASRGFVSVVSRLLTLGAPFNVPSSLEDAGWTAPFWAIEGFQMSTLRTLLEAGADPSSVDLDGNSLLFNAVDVEVEVAQTAGRLPTAELTRLLLSFGADPNTRNKLGQTALDLAVVRGHRAASFLLGEIGAERGTLIR